jgi:transposase
MKPEHTTHMATQTTTTKTKRTEAKRSLTSQAPDIQTPVTHEAKPAPLPEIIHLGIDVHLRQYVVCRKIDGATPQPAQRMTPPQFEAWAIKQKSQAQRVVCCYEAGPFGYGLQRRLSAEGITCHVVRPQDWDKHGQRVKTDGRDARELAEALARYEAGNKHALAIVRVPEIEQEQRRAITRQRSALVNEVRRLGAMGRSHGMNYGHDINGRWWRTRPWKTVTKSMPAFLQSLLEPLQALLVQVEEHIKKLTAQITLKSSENTAAAKRPKGLGALTAQIIDNEVLDWSRFNNRRQVSSFTGLCPSEHSSGGSRKQGRINKHGNPKLRHALVEAVWRLMRLQPGWKRLEKVLEKLRGGEGQKAPNKKKIAVALARELAVDLWRLNTGRATLADLGFTAAEASEEVEEEPAAEQELVMSA